MTPNIHASGLTLNDVTTGYVDRRIDFTLGRFRDSIRSVSVLLEDTNGPRGGVDQLCRIRVLLVGQRQPVVAESTLETLRAAIDVSSDCVGRAVARALDRRNAKRRTSPEAQILESNELPPADAEFAV
jgi:putative sigma-54 modulation protein